jgi:sugar-specific transcriptional regulator TrmB
MLKCKNDPSRTYKGTEPSPKGLGYCAHSDQTGSIKVGKDGNKWIIKEIKNGTKRWMKYKVIKPNNVFSKRFNKISKTERFYEDAYDEIGGDMKQNILKYLGATNRSEMVKKIKSKELQDNIKNIISDQSKIPKYIIKRYQKYLRHDAEGNTYKNVTDKHIKLAITYLLIDDYNNNNIFALNIYDIIVKKDKKWEFLMDTSDRGGIMDHLDDIMFI